MKVLKNKFNGFAKNPSVRLRRIAPHPSSLRRFSRGTMLRAPTGFARLASDVGARSPCPYFVFYEIIKFNMDGKF
jgi:hypothetical protein